MKRFSFGRPLIPTAALVAAMALTAKSQETNSTPATLSLSLDALVSKALEKNPKLKFYETELAGELEAAAQRELLTGKDAP